MDKQTAKVAGVQKAVISSTSSSAHNDGVGDGDGDGVGDGDGDVTLDQRSASLEPVDRQPALLVPGGIPAAGMNPRWVQKHVVLCQHPPLQGETLCLPGTALSDTVDCIRFLGSMQGCMQGSMQGRMQATVSVRQGWQDGQSGTGPNTAPGELDARQLEQYIHEQYIHVPVSSLGPGTDDNVKHSVLDGTATVSTSSGMRGLHGRLAAKAWDGRLCVWDLQAQQQVGKACR